MRFTTAIFGLVLASTALASPVPVAEPAALAPRVTLCDVGVPCWVQAQVNATASYMAFTMANLQTPVAQVCATINDASTLLKSTAVTMSAKVTAMAQADADLYKAQVVALVQGLLQTCVDDANAIEAQAVSISADITASVEGFKAVVTDVEAIIGKCTTG